MREHKTVSNKEDWLALLFAHADCYLERLASDGNVDHLVVLCQIHNEMRKVESWSLFPFETAKKLNKKGGKPSDKMEDPRFAKIKSDPRFAKKGEKKNFKVAIDSRFKHMFSDPKFEVTCTVFSKLIFLATKTDARGKLLDRQQRQGEDLKKFYNVEDEDNEAEELQQEEGENIQDSVEEGQSEEDGVDNQDEEPSSSDFSDQDEDELLEQTEKLPQENIPQGKPTNRIAILNCDWERLKVIPFQILTLSRLIFLSFFSHLLPQADM